MADYAKCFQTDGDYWNKKYNLTDPFNKLFPPDTKIISSCIETNDFTSCAAPCGHINLSGYSKLFDGDKKTISGFYN